MDNYWKAVHVVCHEIEDQLLHVRCVRDAHTTISWKHLWFSNPGMRTLVEERNLIGLEGDARRGACHHEVKLRGGKGTWTCAFCGAEFGERPTGEVTRGERGDGS